MEKKKRKRIAKRVAQVGQKDNYFDIGNESEYDGYLEESMGQALKVVGRIATRWIYVLSKKESEPSNNLRQHYRSNGREKIGYASLRDAKSATAAYWDKNEDMRVYKCTICNQFHIGHKKGWSIL